MVNFAKHYTTPLPKLCLMLLWPSSLGLGNPLTDTNSKLQIKSIIMERIMLVPCTGVWRRFLAALRSWMLSDTHDDFRLKINYPTLTQTAMATQLLQRVRVVKNPFKVPTLWLVHSRHMISGLLDFILFYNVHRIFLVPTYIFNIMSKQYADTPKLETLYTQNSVFSRTFQCSVPQLGIYKLYISRDHQCCMLGKRCKLGRLVRWLWRGTLCCYTNTSWTDVMWRKVL